MGNEVETLHGEGGEALEQAPLTLHPSSKHPSGRKMEDDSMSLQGNASHALEKERK